MTSGHATSGHETSTAVASGRRLRVWPCVVATAIVRACDFEGGDGVCSYARQAGGWQTRLQPRPWIVDGVGSCRRRRLMSASAHGRQAAVDYRRVCSCAWAIARKVVEGGGGGSSPAGGAVDCGRLAVPTEAEVPRHGRERAAVDCRGAGGCAHNRAWRARHSPKWRRPQRAAVDCRRACGCAYNQGASPSSTRTSRPGNYMIMNYIIYGGGASSSSARTSRPGSTATTRSSTPAPPTRLK